MYVCAAYQPLCINAVIACTTVVVVPAALVYVCLILLASLPRLPYEKLVGANFCNVIC